MKHFGSAALVALGILALGASSASAAVVCNEAGDCWRTKEKYAYPPEARGPHLRGRLEVGARR